MVADTDAIVYPGAMMVPSLHTLVTNAAVVGTWRG